MPVWWHVNSSLKVTGDHREPSKTNLADPEQGYREHDE